MKRFFLVLLILTLTNTSLAVAGSSKAEKIAFLWIAAECVVKEDLLLPEEGVIFWDGCSQEK